MLWWRLNTGEKELQELDDWRGGRELRSRGGGANEGNSGELVTRRRERVTAGQFVRLGTEQGGDIIAEQGSAQKKNCQFADKKTKITQKCT